MSLLNGFNNLNKVKSQIFGKFFFIRKDNWTFEI